MIFARIVISSYDLEWKIACIRHELRVKMDVAPECRAMIFPTRGGKMRKTWKKPKVVEIAVGMEINSYACAELKK